MTVQLRGCCSGSAARLNPLFDYVSILFATRVCVSPSTDPVMVRQQPNRCLRLEPDLDQSSQQAACVAAYGRPLE